MKGLNENQNLAGPEKWAHEKKTMIPIIGMWIQRLSLFSMRSPDANANRSSIRFLHVFFWRL